MNKIVLAILAVTCKMFLYNAPAQQSIDCSQCHLRNFAGGELQKGDQMIKEADRVLAEAIRMVAALYQDGVLQKPKICLCVP